MLIPLIVIGAVLLLLILLCLLRIRVTVTLNSEVQVTARVLFFKLRLFPRRKKVKWKNYSPKKAAKIAAKKAKKQAKQKAKNTKPDEAKPKKRTLSEKIRLARALCAALFRRTHKYLRLHAARVHISVATEDAAKTAVLYGVVCQSLAYLLALLDRITRLKATEPDVAVQADYLSEKPSADVKLIFSLRVGGAILILLSVAFAYFKAKLDLRHRRKEKEKKAEQARREKSAQKG